MSDRHMTPAPRPIGYWLAPGTWIPLPRVPIDAAGLVVPCWVTKPDGTRIWVEEKAEDESA